MGIILPVKEKVNGESGLNRRRRRRRKSGKVLIARTQGSLYYRKVWLDVCIANFGEYE